MSMSDSEKALHDRVARHIADTRFPFDGQADWPADYQTVVNAGNPRAATRVKGYTHFPDILVLDGQERPKEIGEVEMELRAEIVPRLTLSSMAVPFIEGSDIRHFFLYVPAEYGDQVLEFITSYRLSVAGVRTFEIDENDDIHIKPVETKGHAKDHLET